MLLGAASCREGRQGGLSAARGGGLGPLGRGPAQELAERRAVPHRLRDAALELDKAYIPTRYPNAHPAGAPRTRYTQGEATRLIGNAEDIYKFCSDLLSTL